MDLLRLLWALGLLLLWASGLQGLQGLQGLLWASGRCLLWPLVWAFVLPFLLSLTALGF